jgi:hypothetical protein
VKQRKREDKYIDILCFLEAQKSSGVASSLVASLVPANTCACICQMAK